MAAKERASVAHPRTKAQKDRVVAVATVKNKSKPILPVVKDRSGSKLRLRSTLDFTRPQFARLLSVSERTIAGVEGGDRSAADKLLRTYRETELLCAALAELVQKDAVGPWLLSENESFGGRKPIELIESGRTNELWETIFRLRYGMPT